MRRNSFLISLIVLVSVIAAMSGCVISPRRIVGQGGSPTPTPSPTGTPSPGIGGKLYVTDQSANSILRFDNALTASTGATPAATIFGSNTGLNGPQFLKLDAAADRLFVANASGGSVLVFDSISTSTGGNIAPTRTITGPSTNPLIAPSDVALDKTRDLLYVADGPDIFVFSSASTVNGTDQPTKDIAVFSGTAQIQSQGIFLDAVNDRLYITDPARNAIDVFDNASALNSPAIANREISGTSTNLAGPASVALDAFGNLVVANPTNGSITVYASAATANGDMAPIATIRGSATTLLRPSQVIRNPGNTANEIYVADFNANEVAVFSSVSTATGNVAPVRQITGTITAQGVALDTTR